MFTVLHELAEDFSTGLLLILLLDRILGYFFLWQAGFSSRCKQKARRKPACFKNFISKQKSRFFLELFNLILSNFVCPSDRGLILLFIEQQLKTKSYFLDG